MNDFAALPDIAGGNYARLLRRLDADPNRAAERYQELRRLLIKFFFWNRASHPKDLADETIARVAEKAVEDIRGKLTWRCAGMADATYDASRIS